MNGLGDRHSLSSRSRRRVVWSAVLRHPKPIGWSFREPRKELGFIIAIMIAIWPLQTLIHERQLDEWPKRPTKDERSEVEVFRAFPDMELDGAG